MVAWQVFVVNSNDYHYLSYLQMDENLLPYCQKLTHAKPTHL